MYTKGSSAYRLTATFKKKKKKSEIHVYGKLLEKKGFSGPRLDPALCKIPNTHKERQSPSGTELVCGYNYRPQSDLFTVNEYLMVLATCVKVVLVPQHNKQSDCQRRNLSGLGTWSPKAKRGWGV